MEQENNKNEGESAGVGLALSQASEKKSSNLSKAKSDIAKSMARNFLKTRKATHTSEVRRRNRKKKNKSLSEGSKVTENDAKKQNSREENPQKDATTSMVHVENSRQIQKNEENTYGSGGNEKSSKSSQSSRKQRRGGGTGLLNKNRKNEEKLRGNKRRKWNEQMEKRRISENNNKNKEKNDGKGKKQENKMKERIDGLIFLCNAKTKPDCFRYRVMGVSNGKKDLVLGIRRGLKLFLYDYDLKLMYGVYKASTSGGMKLEPEAFGGAFPAQVRFSVHADCFPLAESIFKKAIKENYNKNNKFKTELTARQVRKLTKLFRPVAVHSTALPVHSPPSRVAARIREHPNREAHDRPREARPRSDREASARDPYANISARSYRVLSHERDRQITYGELASARREDIHRDLYLNENDYGAHDRPREARPPSDREASAKDPYANISARSYRVLSHERDQQIMYGELASARREDIHRDLYLNENDYGSYGFQGERRNSSFQPHTAPRLGSYHRDYNEQPLCQPEMAYRESVPIQRNIIPSDPLYLPQRQYRSYDLGATQAMQSTVTAATANTSVAAASTLDSYATDPYYSQYYGGETHLIESDHLRRENNQVDRSYLTYASDALADYNQMQRHHDVKPVAASTSVSYRYSFTGASFSYL